MNRTFRTTFALAAVAGAAGCASGGPLSPPGGPRGPANPAGVPGFDLREHPGDAALSAWRASSPYRWLGFYLPAPCYTGTSWRGRRDELRRDGWGLGVLFIGEQDWAQVGASARMPADTSGAAATEPRCTSGNLSAEKGARDGRAAVAAAREEGFAPGTWIYLDVEPVESVSTGLAAYARAWTGALLDEGTYRPGLYAHARNAERLLSLVRAEWSRRGLVDAPRLWVTGGSGFDLEAAPTASGAPAHVWQGPLDRRETWGGVSLVVDPNVAASADPSGG